MEIQEACDGFEVGTLKVFGLSEVYEVALDSGDIWVLGELKGKGILAIGYGSQIGQIQFFDYSRELSEVVGESLRDAILELRRRKGS